MYRSADRAQKRYGETFLYCNQYWGQWHLNQGSNAWTYSCFWHLNSLPGASPGIFNNVTRYEMYYWIGNDSLGNAIARLWATGTF